jgi:endogenous inhibitor of DNA gyrase (YacG/DUF329 family)
LWTFCAHRFIFFRVRSKCPTCGRIIEREGAGATPPPHRPFCSERCRAADLGNWLNASYRISAPVSEEDLDEGLPTAARDGDLDKDKGTTN